MEWIKGIWLINLFFLTLILLFIWSKLSIIVRKIATINTILDQISKIPSTSDQPG